MGSTSPAGRAFIAHEEGEVLHWYRDEADIETGGVGHVRQPGDPDTFGQAESDAWLENDLRVADGCVTSLVHGAIGQNMHDACVSLTFNIGTGGFASSSVLRLMNAGDYLAAADAFMLWNKVTIDGVLQVSPVLKARRARERAMFLLDVATLPNP